MRIFYSKFSLILISFLLFSINIYLFYPILSSTSLIFPYALRPFDIVSKYPSVWKIIKLMYYTNSYISIFLILNSIFSFKQKKITKNIKSKKVNLNTLKDEFHLFVGYNSLTQEEIVITEKSLYQNILITGTIGSRQD